MVLIAVRVHPFPSRTRKLSSLAPKILAWRRAGKIGNANTKETAILVVSFVIQVTIQGKTAARISLRRSFCSSMQLLKKGQGLFVGNKLSKRESIPIDRGENSTDKTYHTKE